MADPLGLISNSGAIQSGQMPRAQGPKDPNQADFKDLLMQNIEKVNQLQQDAEMALEDLGTGKRDDLANVMIAKQKADMAFTMLLQVRNKLMDAYSEIKDIRV